MFVKIGTRLINLDHVVMVKEAGSFTEVYMTGIPAFVIGNEEQREALRKAIEETNRLWQVDDGS